MSIERYPTDLGFKGPESSTHTSRTMMLAELSTLFATVPMLASRDVYVKAILEENILGKSTVATRKLTLQRLSELYAIDPTLPLFRVFRVLWSRREGGSALLALLMALARDGLLRASAGVVVALNDGDELIRQNLMKALMRAAGERLNESIAAKVARNIGSSWTQSGHLVGRVRKIRHKVNPSLVDICFALYLGHLQGLRGQALISSEWTRVLDSSPTLTHELAAQGRAIGLLDIKISRELTDVSFPFDFDQAWLGGGANVSA